MNKFAHLLTLKKHYFNKLGDSVEGLPDDPLTGESPPSPQLFSDVFGLQDLIDLAIESSLLIEDPVDSSTKISFKLRTDFYPIA